MKQKPRPLQSNQNKVEYRQTKSNCNNFFLFNFVTVFDLIWLCSQPKSNQIRTTYGEMIDIKQGQTRSNRVKQGQVRLSVTLFDSIWLCYNFVRLCSGLSAGVPQKTFCDWIFDKHNIIARPLQSNMNKHKQSRNNSNKVLQSKKSWNHSNKVLQSKKSLNEIIKCRTATIFLVLILTLYDCVN